MYGVARKFQKDPHWKDYILFCEYFVLSTGGIGSCVLHRDKVYFRQGFNPSADATPFSQRITAIGAPILELAPPAVQITRDRSKAEVGETNRETWRSRINEDRTALSRRARELFAMPGNHTEERESVDRAFTCCAKKKPEVNKGRVVDGWAVFDQETPRIGLTEKRQQASTGKRRWHSS